MALLQIYTALLQIDTATVPANTYNIVNSRNPWPIFLDLVLKEFSISESCDEQVGFRNPLKNFSIFARGG